MPSTVAAFADDLAAHGGDAEAISEVCIDMSPAFIKGTAEHLPNAAITFDKFHAVKIINDAVDAGAPRRTEERKACCAARAISGCAIRTDLSERQRDTSTACPRAISRPHVPIRSGWPSRTSTTSPPAEAATGFLKKWYFWATHSRLDR